MKTREEIRACARKWRKDHPPTPEQRRAANEVTRNWIKKNEKQYKETRRRSYEKDFPFYLFRYTRARAQLQGIPFTITIEWVRSKIADGKCEVTKIPFDFTLNRTNSKRWNPWRPSIDKINPRLGYTKKNSRIVCWAYNHAKRDWDDEIVLTLAKALYEVHSLQAPTRRIRRAQN